MTAAMRATGEKENGSSDSRSEDCHRCGRASDGTATAVSSATLVDNNRTSARTPLTSPTYPSSSSLSPPRPLPILVLCVHKLHMIRVLEHLLGCVGLGDEDDGVDDGARTTTVVNAGDIDNRNNDEDTKENGGNDCFDTTDEAYYDLTKHHGVKVLDSQVVRGRSQDRRGYVVVKLPLVVPRIEEDDATEGTAAAARRHAKRRLEQLSPLARQNVSWVLCVDHYHQVDFIPTEPREDNGIRAAARAATAVEPMWEGLKMHGYQLSTSNDHTIRIDVHPKSETLKWCLAMERHVAQHVLQYSDEQLLKVTEPFVDPNIPLQWTKSRTKCTHHLSIVEEDTLDKDGKHRHVVRWGVECRNRLDEFLLDVKLNHDAHQEVVVVPDTAPVGNQQLAGIRSEEGGQEGAGSSVNGNAAREEGRDDYAPPCTAVPATTTPKKRGSRRGGKRARVLEEEPQQQQQWSNESPTTWTPPLSRAYYKLHQVWKDYLSESSLLSSLQNGHAVDVGASPGGWTQVLLEMGFHKVVAIDPGKVSTRVTSRPGVKHVPKKLEDVTTHDLDVESTSSSTALSSSKVSMVVCDACVLWMDLLDDVLLKVLTTKVNCQFQLPCVWVVTLKLPFKTIGSVRRHAQAARVKIPTYAHELAVASYGPEAVAAETFSIKYQLLHLFANSDSERTLLVTFDERKP